MEKSNKFKLFIGLVYLILILLFLYFFFSKFSIQELTSYDFIRNNRSYFFELKNSNLLFMFFIFLVLTILWVFPFLGFGSPVALMGGFIFGKIINKDHKKLNISFVTKKKIGNAVKRNKIKRRLKNIMNDAVKKISINFEFSVLVIARESMLNNEYKIIKETLFQDLEKIK